MASTPESLKNGSSGKVKTGTLKVSGDNGKVYMVKRATEHLSQLTCVSAKESKTDYLKLTADDNYENCVEQKSFLPISVW